MSLAVVFALCFVATFVLIWWIDRRRAGRVARQLREQKCPACGGAFDGISAGDLFRPFLRRRRTAKSGLLPRLWALTCPHCGRECWYRVEKGTIRHDRTSDRRSQRGEGPRHPSND